MERRRRMFLRKIGTSIVLAVAVAFVAHGLIFRGAHDFGGIASGRLASLALAGLALWLAGAFLRALLGDGRGARGPAPSLLPRIAPGGFAAYALGELLEGRSPLSAGLAVVAACSVAALAVDALARAMLRLVRRTAAALAAVSRYLARRDRFRYAARSRRAHVVEPVRARGGRLGRAPPIPG